MKHIAHFLVKLRVPDLVALTAKRVIIKHIGISQLVDMQREDWWQIYISGEEEVENYARDIAEKSSLFVNPNKHTYRLQVADSRGTKFCATTLMDGLWVVPVGVWHYDDMSSDIIKRTLRERLFYKKVEGVKKGILWTLKIRGKNRSEAKKVAEEITLCKSRKRGLLSNPHVNYYQVF